MLNKFNISELSEEDKKAYHQALGAWHLYAFQEDLGGYRQRDLDKQDAVDSLELEEEFCGVGHD